MPLHPRKRPQLIKSKKQAKGESVAAECNGIVVMKRRDKKEVSFISTFDDSSMQTQTVWDSEISKRKCIRHLKLAMVGVDLKGQMV